MPFTRQGTITLYGDRRIKRGSWVYFVPTGELYYVEQVSNTFKSVGESIQRTTSLQVSHGMFVRNINSAWRNGEYDKIYHIVISISLILATKRLGKISALPILKVIQTSCSNSLLISKFVKRYWTILEQETSSGNTDKPLYDRGGNR